MKYFMSITHGFQARMLLRTKIAELLRSEGSQLVILSPNANEQYFEEEFTHPQHHLTVTPQRTGSFETIVRSTRSYLLMNPGLGDTMHYKQDRYRQNYPFRAAFARLGNRVLGHSPILRNAYLRGESLLFSGREYDALFREHHPDRVITGTPGYNVIDAHLLRAARRMRVPSATVMLSWDNLTSKGHMAAQPDLLLVWNQLMASEAVRYHDYRGDIFEVGAAQFDHYWALGGEDRLSYRTSLGLDLAGPLIVWGTINEDIYPGQLRLLKAFVAQTRRDMPTAHIWIRVHPQSVSGRFAPLSTEYLALGSDSTTVEIPNVQSTALRWDLPQADMFHLARLLRAADVVVTPQSTLTIDAACAGTPVINLAIDPAFARTMDYTHYRNVVQSGGVCIVRSLTELGTAVDAYVRERSLHASGRERIVREQMGAYAGRAALRTAEVLLADWALPAAD